MKGEKKKQLQKKTTKVWPSKAYPVETEAITSRKKRFYKKKKNENYI